MKKISLFLLILFLFFVCSCDDKEEQIDTKPNIEEKVVPIYEGVSFLSEDLYEERARMNKNKDDKEKDEKDDIVDEIIKETIDNSFGVITQEELSYYTVKGEKAYITLNFYNPDQYEILSFVLNGVKYQTFQFTEDSNAEAITVGVTIPETSGVFEYYIEQVKYIDGTEIKDCKMEGNQSVKIGIGYDITPNADSKVEASYDNLTIDTTIIDSSNVVEKSDGEFKIFVFDENGVLIDCQPVKIGKNNAHFKNLEVNTKYRYVIATSYDAFDGEGQKTDVLDEGEIVTKNCISIANQTVTTDSISFDITKELDEITLVETNLYLADKLVETTTDEAIHFSNLYSNTLYKVSVKYVYNDTEYLFDTEYTTLEMMAPAVNLEVISEKDSIEYSVVVSDENNLFNLTKVEIIKDGVTVDSKNVLSDTFINLLSNTAYVIKVSYTYDLNNALGVVSEEISKEIKTKELSLPTYGLNYTKGDLLIDGEIIVLDTDNTSTLTSINLYRTTDEVLVNSTTSNQFSFAISPNTSYKIVINYEYDLRDGLGKQAGIYEFDFYSSKVAPTFKITQLSLTSNLMEFDLNINDLSLCGEVKNIYLYKGTEIVKKVSLTDYELTDLTSNTSYKLVVDYAYDLEDGLGVRVITEEYEFTTLKSTPTVVVENTVVSEQSIKVNPTIVDPDNAGTLSKVELYLNNNLVDSQTEKYLFSGLLSNTKYEVRCYYTYDINLGESEMVVSKEITTSRMEAPTVSVELNSTKNSISYKVLNGNATITNVELIKDDVVVNISYDLEGVFDGILSNNDYTVKVNYTYDLNDGNGVSSSYISKNIKTKAYTAPSVGINTTSLTDKEIAGQLVVEDSDNLFNLVNISLYQNGSLIATVSSGLNYSFTVQPNVTYQIKVTYAYDLNDGNGQVVETYEKELTSYKEIPVVSINAYYVSTNEVYYDFYISDVNNVGHVKSIRLYENGSYIKDLNQYENALYDLNTNTKYKIVSVYVYDLDDGLGSREVSYEYEFMTLKHNPEYYLSADSTSRSITISHNMVDPDNALTYKYTRVYLSDELISEYNDMDMVEFDNLLSNNLYRIEVGFVCDINNGEFDYVRSISVYTHNLNAPYVNIEAAATKKEISFEYTYDDFDKVIVSKEVYLLLNGQDKVELEALNGIFSNLLSDNHYQLVVAMLCDFNDGKGEVEVLYTVDLYTLPLLAPTVDLEFTSTPDSITFEEKVIDNDNIFEFESVEVYLLDELVMTLTDINEKTVNELQSNNIYTFVYNYSYDLNNGNEKVLASYSESFSTLAHPVEITDFMILNEYEPKTNEDVNIKLYLNNLSKVNIRTVTINNEVYNVMGGNTIDDVIVVADSGDVSGNISFEITAISYELNGFIVTQEITFDKDIIVTVLSRLNILNISTIDGSNTYKLNNKYNNFVVNIDNPDGYEILSVNYGQTWSEKEAEVIMIDDNHITFPIEEWYINERRIYISGITYIDIHGNKAVRNYQQEFLISAAGLNADESTYSLVVNYISTPEEFIAMETGKAYELVADIDMTGYNWTTRDFDGYFDGKGHSIKNLTMIKEDENTNSRSIALFRNLDGIFRNVYFENLYINIQTKADLYLYLLNSGGNPELTSVLISGAAVLNTTATIDYGSSLNKPYYIVDDFMINNNVINYNNNIKSKDLTDEFKEETLGWVFVDREFLTYDNFEYYLIDDSYVFISKYIGDSSKVVIPDEIDGKPVIGIGDFAFSNNTRLEEFVFNENVLYLGGSVFAGCSNLEVISNINQYVSSVYTLFGNVEYSDSYKISTAYIPTSLQKVTFNDDVTTIPEHLFYSFESIKEVVFPTSLISIGSYAFEGCTSLLEVNLPNGLEHIGDCAFRYCSSLRNLFIPNSVDYIGNEAFNSCGLRAIRVPKDIQKIQSYALGVGAKIYFSGSESEWKDLGKKCNDENYFEYLDTKYDVEIAEYVNSEKYEYILVDEAFVTEFYILDKEITEFDFAKEFKDLEVKSLAHKAFYECKDLKEIIIPEGVVSIGSDAFAFCSSLKSVLLPKTLKTIESGAFFSTIINTITIPDSVEVIAQGALDTGNLKVVCLSKSLEKLEKIFASGGAYIKVIYLPKSIKSISPEALNDLYFDAYVYYEGSEEEWLDLGVNNNKANIVYNVNTLECISNESESYQIVNKSEIHNYANLDKNINVFDFTKEFEDLEVKSLAVDAFYQCKDLKEIIIPEGVVNIGSYAFNDCSSLKSVVLPKTLKTIGTYAFCGTMIENIVIPDSVEVIGEKALCSGYLNEVYLSKSLEKLEEIFSDGGYNIEIIYMPKSIKYISPVALKNCKNTTYVYYEGSEEEWLKLGVTINANIVYNVNALEKVSNETASYQLVNKTEIYNYNRLDQEIIEFDFEKLYPGYNLVSLHVDAFNGCSLLEKVVLPEGLEEIPYGAFYQCTKLANITLPSSLLKIGTRAFFECYDLQTLVLPEGLQYISSEFISNTAIKSLSIPDSVIEIEDNALFSYNLMEVYLPNGLTEIKQFFTNQGNELAKLYIPASVTKIHSNTLDEINHNALILYSGSEKEWENLNSNIDCNIVYNFSHEKYINTLSARYTLINDIYVCNYYQNDKNITEFDFEKLYPNYILISLASNAFIECSALRKVELPSTLKVIPHDIFNSTWNLNELNIKEGVVYIEGIYSGNLNRITFPSTLKKLTDFKPNDVKEIVFYGSTAPIWSGLEGVNYLKNSEFRVYIPKGSYSSYANISNEDWQMYVVEQGKLIECEQIELDILANKVTFNNLIVAYDGKSHRIEVQGNLPSNTTVVYEGNEQSEVGNHTVTATFSVDGYEVVSLTANLFIYDALSSDATGFEYSIIDNSAMITKYTGDSNIARIPSIIIDQGKEYIVKRVATAAFDNCNLLEILIVPESIETIDNQAFRNCSSLTKVIFEGDCSKGMGSDVFANTWNSSKFMVYVKSEYYDSYIAISDNYWQSSIVEAGKIAVYD